MVAASQAVKQHDYFCLECAGILRMRAGPHRQTHFYHLELSPKCRQSQKSMEHLQTQCFVQQQLGREECCLEWRFPASGRIADAVWFSKKLIFEIQCSPIALEEVQARMQDYRREGYQVVWLLHERAFNQKRLSAAEQFLRDHPCYYSSIDAQGKGILYDQFDRVARGIRFAKFAPLQIDVKEPKETQLLPQRVPQYLGRWRRQPLYFSGALLDLFAKQEASDYFKNIFDVEGELEEKPKRLGSFWKLLKRSYLSLFRAFLESSTYLGVLW